MLFQQLYVRFSESERASRIGTRGRVVGFMRESSWVHVVDSQPATSAMNSNLMVSLFLKFNCQLLLGEEATSSQLNESKCRCVG